LTESTKTEEANGGSETNGEEEDCKKVIGAKIIEIAQKKKTDDKKFNDDVIYGDTGANSFECLVLQIAMQESSLQHCKSEQEDGNCFYCDEGGLKLLRNKEGTDCYGVMQIDIGEKANLKMKDSVDNFTKNVEFGIDYLIRYYSESPKYYECGEAKYYYGWNKSLRYYNGWNTDCSKGEIYYVEEVTGKKDKSNGENTKKQVIELFPELCGKETTLPKIKDFYLQRQNGDRVISEIAQNADIEVIIEGGEDCEEFKFDIYFDSGEKNRLTKSELKSFIKGASSGKYFITANCYVNGKLGGTKSISLTITEGFTAESHS